MVGRNIPISPLYTILGRTVYDKHFIHNLTDDEFDITKAFKNGETYSFLAKYRRNEYVLQCIPDDHNEQIGLLLDSDHNLTVRISESFIVVELNS